MQSTGRLSLQVRVGLFVIAGASLLLVAVAALSNWSLTPTVPMFAEFSFAGGLQRGAPVRLGGVQVGSVAALEALDGTVVRDDGLVVRVRVQIEDAARGWVRPGTCLAMNTQGFIGEPYLEVVPGESGRAPLPPGSTLCGVSMPPFYRVFSDMASLVERLLDVLAHPALKGDKIGEIMAAVHGIMDEIDETWVRGGRFKSIADDAEATLHAMRRDLPTILSRGRSAVTTLDTTLHTMNAWMHHPQAREMWGRAQRSTEKLEALATTADLLLQDMKAGKGTAGAVLADPQLYDDLKELVRDLRRHPWKLVWKD